MMLRKCVTLSALAFLRPADLSEVIARMGFDYSRKNKRWRKLRDRVLRRQKWCQEAERYGLRVQAEVVHHIWPAEDYPEFAYCEWNLVALSRENHDRMHDRLTRKLSPLGERWRRRTIPPASTDEE